MAQLEHSQNLIQSLSCSNVDHAIDEKWEMQYFHITPVVFSFALYTTHSDLPGLISKVTESQKALLAGVSCSGMGAVKGARQPLPYLTMPYGAEISHCNASGNGIVVRRLDLVMLAIDLELAPRPFRRASSTAWTQDLNDTEKKRVRFQRRKPCELQQERCCVGWPANLVVRAVTCTNSLLYDL